MLLGKQQAKIPANGGKQINVANGARKRGQAQTQRNQVLLTRSGIIRHFQSFSDVETQRWMTQAQPSAEQPNGRLGGGLIEGVLETYSCMRQLSHNVAAFFSFTEH